MGQWEQDGKNVNYMARIFFRNRVGTTIVWHQLGCGKVFLAYQGFGTEERGKKYQILCFKKSVRTHFDRFFFKKLKIHDLWT